MLLSFFCVTGCHVMKAPPHISSSNEQIRAELLFHTPKGTSATNVLGFVTNQLRPPGSVLAFAPYVDAIEAASAQKLRAQRDKRRRIRVMLGEAPNLLEFFVTTQVIAEWQFDITDNLTDVIVERVTRP
jgi:hypothetical protein